MDSNTIFHTFTTVRLILVISVVLITSIQAVSPLYCYANDIPHHDEIPTDNNSENEVKELQELEVEKILSDRIYKRQDVIIKLDSKSEVNNFTEQHHKDLSDPPPEVS